MSLWRDSATRRDLLWLALLGLLIQTFWAWRLHHPSYFDAYYYTTNAQRLAEGHGFSEEIIWEYLSDPDSLPTPSFMYWMPLPSLLAAAGYLISGGAWRGAQIPFWLMAGLLPWLSYAINWQLRQQRWQARLAALFTLCGGYYAAYWNQPTTFALFAWTGGGCLLALGMAWSRNTAVPWFLAGILAGLSHLTRADGILLVGVGGLIWLGQVWTWRHTKQVGILSAQVVSLAVFLLGYLLVMGGWFWRTYQLTGQIMSTVGTQTIFMTTYNDVFSYGRSFDFSTYLAWGGQNILLSKLKAAWLAVQTFIAVTGLTVFTVFMLLAWVKLGREKEAGRLLRPFTLYAPLLYGVMALIFTFPGQRGSLLHSSTALWPWSMALVVVGIDIAIDWVAARRRVWKPTQAKRLFSGVFVFMFLFITLFVSGGQPLAQEEAAVYAALAADLPADAVVMIGTAPDFYYHTGRRAVSVPNEPPDVLLTIARRYGVDYLVLDIERPPVLAALYEGRETHPQIHRLQAYDQTRVLYQFDREAP